MNSIYFITLGCSKNEVDSNNMMWMLDKTKYYIAESIEEADVIVINTCGFIEAAKEESIDTIIEAAKYKEKNCKKLILAGCLAQRYSKELMEEIPEIDGILGTGNIKDINQIIGNLEEENKIIRIDNLNSDYIEGLSRLSYGHSEYVKISEGCNNNCSYCIIPRLRGKNRSRKIEDIYAEVKELVENGTKEVILIAQNTTDYGIDLYGDYALAKLIKEISKIEDLVWIRVLYLYPDHFTDELIEEFKNNEKLVKYVDIPLQHISNNVLKNMNRNTDFESINRLIDDLRTKIPEIILRTTFIVGFPGEEEEDFNKLLDFINKVKFDKLGVFTYSKEEDTPAYNMDNQVDENVKAERLESIMSVQQGISEKKMETYIGKTFDVLIDDYCGEDIYEGRTYMDTPEIDGIVYVNSSQDLNKGDFVKVKINDSMEYDLIGEMLWI